MQTLSSPFPENVPQDLQKHTTNLHFLSSSVARMPEPMHHERIMNPRLFSASSTSLSIQNVVFLCSIPGGHFMHPSTPLVEELENVPRGHGNNVATSQFLSGILLNPVAKRAEVKCVFIWG